MELELKLGRVGGGQRVFRNPRSLETSFRLCLGASLIFVARVGVEFVVFLVVVDLVRCQCVVGYVLPRGRDFDVCGVVYAHDGDGFSGPSVSDVEASELAAPSQCCFAVFGDFVGSQAVVMSLDVWSGVRFG